MNDCLNRPPAAGFTIVELMVTVSLTAVLFALAMPSFRSWIGNAQIRTASDAIQNGARLAQSEAVRRSRQVVLFRTDSSNCSSTLAAASAGKFWALRTVAVVDGQAVDVIQCGTLLSEQSSVSISGPAALCFNSGGRQTANAAPGIGGTACTLDATGSNLFDITSSSADRPLRVLVSLGGSVQMCDPAKTLSASTPDGCP
ncbi:pilus assembly FimT family protein [Roseateles sp. GG27B]